MTIADPKEIQLRPMRLADVPEIAKLHRLAFVGYMNTRLGSHYLHAFFRWFCKAEEAIALCAFGGDQPVGYIVGAPLGYAPSLNRAVLPAALAGIVLRPQLLFNAPFRQAISGRWNALCGIAPPEDAPDLPEPTLSLVGIAVHPDARGRHIGQQLIDVFEAKSCEVGARSLRLSVYSDNHTAVKLYTRSGWKCHPRSGDRADYFYKVMKGKSFLNAEPAVDCESEQR